MDLLVARTHTPAFQSSHGWACIGIPRPGRVLVSKDSMQSTMWAPMIPKRGVQWEWQSARDAISGHGFAWSARAHSCVSIFL